MSWAWEAGAQTDAGFGRCLPIAEALVGRDERAACYLKGLVCRLRLFRLLTHTFRDFIVFRNKLKLTRDEPMFKYYATTESPFVKDEKKRELEVFLRREIGTALQTASLIEAASNEGIEIIQTADLDAFTNVMNLPPAPRLVREIRRKAAIMERCRGELGEIYRRDHIPNVNY